MRVETHTTIPVFESLHQSLGFRFHLTDNFPGGEKVNYFP